jgi:hypothetical protein
MYGFRRGRRTFTGDSGYIIDRFILPVRQILDEYIYRAFFGGFGTRAASSDDFLAAFSAGFSFYQRILNTMEPGTYHLDAKMGELVAGRSQAADAINVEVGLDHGKYLKSRFDQEGNVEKVLNRGIELDKIAVLWAFSLRGYPSEKYARASLNFNYFDFPSLKGDVLSTFSDAMRDSLTADMVIARNPGETDFQLLQEGVSINPEAELQMVKGRPATSQGIKQYAMLFAAANFNNQADVSFGDYIDFRIAGIDDSFSAEVPTVSFSNLANTKTYVIPNTLDGSSISYALGLKANADQTTLNQLLNLPLEELALESFATAWGVAQGEPISEGLRETLRSEFSRYQSAMLDLMVQWVAENAEGEASEQLASLLKVFQERLEDMNSIGNLQRNLSRYEADLTLMGEFYEVFN